MIRTVFTWRATAIPPMEASRTRKPTVAAIPATPSFSVKPRATPMAKIRARLVKMTSPAPFIRVATTRTAPLGECATRAEPMASMSPATGSTATGSISALPIFCMNGNMFLNMMPP